MWLVVQLVQVELTTSEFHQVILSVLSGPFCHRNLMKNVFHKDEI